MLLRCTGSGAVEYRCPVMPEHCGASSCSRLITGEQVKRAIHRIPGLCVDGTTGPEDAPRDFRPGRVWYIGEEEGG